MVHRCHLLASRASRLNSPSLLVTNHDARLFPEALGGGSPDAPPATPLKFDRILADVPCSGDGTLRKNPLIWKRWQAAPGNMLHALQLQIACKAVRLLKVRGCRAGARPSRALELSLYALLCPGGWPTRLFNLLPQSD